MKHLYASFALLFACSQAPAAYAASIMNSKHDLSAGSATTGPKAATVNRTCVFCHSPHKTVSAAPLWNHVETGQAFTFYSSNYLNAYLGMQAPTMADLAGTRTKLCLSCHDGVTALGGVYNIGGAPGTIDVTGSMASSAVLGPDLSNDHPVLYDVKPGAGPPTAPGTDPEIQLPPAQDRVKTYGANNRVECTSCHDPHDDQYGDFLVKSNANAALCTTCHQKNGFSASVHATSNVAYTPPGGSPTSVGANACNNCHKAHGSAATEGLAYLMGAAEENACYACHGTPPLSGAEDVRSEFAKVYKHPTETVSGVHLDPETDASNLGNAARHAECWDCHNPHRLQSGTSADRTAGSNLIPGVLLGQWGVEPVYGGTPWVNPGSYLKQDFANTAQYKEYQLCLKCHSSYAYGSSPPPGYSDQSIEFNPNNASRHPVLGAGDNPYCTPTGANGNRITMEPPFNQGPGEHDTILCSDCHGSDDPANPRGPHGSGNNRILKESLTAARYSQYGNAYGTPLCLKCHKAGVYLDQGDGSAFQKHNKNVHHRAPGDPYPGSKGGCLVCHGVSAGQNFHGENFQWAATSKTQAGPGLRFISNSSSITGWQPGRCYSTNSSCHGGNHDESY